LTRLGFHKGGYRLMELGLKYVQALQIAADDKSRTLHTQVEMQTRRYI
jgi:hypothetical protein